MATDILQGWKEIEKYIGLGHETILAQGYPIRKCQRTGGICALKSELLEHVLSMPVMPPVNFRQDSTTFD